MVHGPRYLAASIPVTTYALHIYLNICTFTSPLPRLTFRFGQLAESVAALWRLEHALRTQGRCGPPRGSEGGGGDRVCRVEGSEGECGRSELGRGNLGLLQHVAERGEEAGLRKGERRRVSEEMRGRLGGMSSHLLVGHRVDLP